MRLGLRTVVGWLIVAAAMSPRAFAAELSPCERAAVLSGEARAMANDARTAEAVTLATRAVELCPGDRALSAQLSELRRITGDEEQKKEAAGTLLPRLELVVFQTAHVGFQGYALGYSLDRDGPAPAVFALIGGVGAGVAAAWLTRNGVELADVLLIDSGSVWALALMTVAAVGLRAPTGTEWLLNVAGAVGLGAGLLAAHFWAPEAGQVSYMNSVALWLSLSSAWATFSLTRGRGTGPLFAFIGGSLGGLTIGALTSRFVHPTRGEMLLIDLGGAVGAVVGLIGVNALGLASDRETSPAAIMPPAFTVGGLALATMLVVSRHRVGETAPERSPSVSLLPGAPGAVAGGSLVAAW